MGAGGVDVQLSAIAIEKFPYSIECKYKETSGPIYKWYNQAKANLLPGTEPLLVIKRNHHDPVVVLDFDYFMKLLEVKE